MNVLHASATTARLNAAIDAAEPHLRPVLVAVRDYRVGVLFIAQGSGPFSIPAAPARPAAVLIGDDFERSMGPGGFDMPSIERAMRVCAAFTVVTCAPTPEIYTAAMTGAVAGHNIMLIETRLQHEAAWVALIQRLAPGKPLLLATVKGGVA